MTTRDDHHRARRHRARPVHPGRPEGRPELRRPGEEGLLRRRHLPPRHPGLRRPGGRRPVRQEVEPRRRPRRHRRPGLQVRGRADPRRLRPRRAGDGQRRPEHERQPVLHLRRRPVGPAAQELHDLRPGDEGHGRRRQDRQRAAEQPRPAGFARRDDVGDDRTRSSRPAGMQRADRARITPNRPLQCGCNGPEASVEHEALRVFYQSVTKTLGFEGPLD